MRIIGGVFRGRVLKSPKTREVRPTTGRLRESISSALEYRIGGFQDKRVADIFAGTGALGLEALSRGAAFAAFVEKSPDSLDLLKANIEMLGVKGKTKILSENAKNLSGQETPFDVIFMDPPYGRELAQPALEGLVKGHWLSRMGTVVLECEKKEVIEAPSGLAIKKSLTQGYRAAHFIEFSD